MKFCSLLLLFQLASCGSTSGTAQRSPESVVHGLYQQIVARRPLGIPKRADKAAIWPFLSKTLIRRLEVAQACEDDYYKQHIRKDEKPVLGLPRAYEKPTFGWLEVGLFSGWHEQGIPAEAVVQRTEPQKDGTLHVYVRLTYKESFETYGRPPDPANTFHWIVVAVVIPEGARFAVDDVLLFKDDSTEIDSRLRDSFSGCAGSRWVGNTAKN